MNFVPTPFESAQLNVQLFGLRREAVLREARDWFLREYNPESFAELIAVHPLDCAQITSMNTSPREA